MSKNCTQNHIKAIALSVAMTLLPLASQAAGLGKITVHSALGQPLRAELEVTATRDEAASLAARVASADAFRLAGIEYAPALASIRFSREIKERGGRRFIELSTDRPLNEPFVDMLVELSWSAGRLVREYTFLLDPPELVSKLPPPVSIAPPEVRAETRPDPRSLANVPPSPAPVPLQAQPVPVPAQVMAAPPAPPVPPAPAPLVEREVPPRAPAAEVPSPARWPAEPVPARPVEKAAEDTALKSATKLSKPAKAVEADKSDKFKDGRKVVSGDTLGKIASETRHQSVSFDQMVVGLFRQNQDAFEGGNMNRLKAGKILAVPDAEVVNQVPTDEARKEILAQAADFNAYRKKLAEAAAGAPVKEQPAKQSAAGKIVPKVEDKAPPVAAGKDKLEVSRSEAAKGAAGGKQLQGRVASMEEDMVARSKALKEADSRIALLEKNIQDMKKLAELKSSAGADLQKQAQAAKAEPAKPAAAPVVPAAPAAPVVAEAPKVAAAPPPAAPAADAAKPAPEAKPADAKPADAPKPPPTPKAPPPPPEPEPTFMEENGPMVVGAGGVLGLLFGWLGFSAYRKKRAAKLAMQEADAEPSVASSSSFSAAPLVASSRDDQEVSQFSTTSSSIQSAAAAEAIDPLSEADTFLAFGRDAQAEEILLDALKKDPNRQAIHLKLLDIYYGRKNVSQFAVIAEQLHPLVSGAGEDWDKVAAMGREIDPANALYGGAAAVEASTQSAAPDFASTMVMQAPVLEAPPAEPEPEPEIAAVSDTEASALDFNLDLDAPAEAAVAEEPAEVTALDLDFDVQAPDAPEPAATEPSLDVMLETGKFEPPAAPVEEALDLPLEALELDAPKADGNSVDFEFEIKKPEPEVAPPEEMALDMPDLEMPEPSPEIAALDLGDLSLELETLPESGVEPAGAVADMLSEATGEAKGDDAGTPAKDNPEVTTKLELATAYEEMGDKDGARELYEEAVKEGSPAQQEQARAKLASLG